MRATLAAQNLSVRSAHCCHVNLRLSQKSLLPYSPENSYTHARAHTHTHTHTHTILSYSFIEDDTVTAQAKQREYSIIKNDIAIAARPLQNKKRSHDLVVSLVCGESYRRCGSVSVTIVARLVTSVSCPLSK